MAGVDNNQLKNQANMIAGMDDTQLQQHIDRMKGFNPMFANITPQQLRMMSGSMNNMNDDQLNQAKGMAQSQFGGGAPQAPP